MADTLKLAIFHEIQYMNVLSHTLLLWDSSNHPAVNSLLMRGNKYKN